MGAAPVIRAPPPTDAGDARQYARSMAFGFALMIDVAPPNDPRIDFTGTFREVEPDAPALSVSDLGVQRGDGVFETIGVVDGHAQEVEAHLDRLVNSARVCDLPEPNRLQWRQAAFRAASECPPGESIVKLVLSRGPADGQPPTAWVTASAAPDNATARERGLRLVTLDRGIDPAVAARAPWLLLGAKTLSYAPNMAALRDARRRGADDALFVTADGDALEAPTSSLIVRFGERFVTPEPTEGILHGTTQLSAFAWLEAQGFTTAYTRIRVDELAHADAAWLLSSVRLAAPVTAIDDLALAIDADLTRALNTYLLSPRD